MTTHWRWLATLAAIGTLAASCADDPPSGGLLLLITRDGPLPLDRLDLTIASKGQILHDTRYRVPEEAALPTTFGITSDGNATATVKITVTGWGDSVPLDRRDAIVTQVPTDRVALLKLVLSGRCTSQVRLQDGQAISACGDDNTCDPATGDCTSAVIDASTLPSYQAGDDPGAAGAGGAASEPSNAAGGVAGNASGDAAGGVAAEASGTGNEAAASGAGGQAQVTCDPGYRDCGGKLADDCETHIDSDVNNCGACGHKCPSSAGHAYCVDANCGETICTPPLADCNEQPQDDCEIDTSSADDNCLGCGLKCSGSTPYCTPGGCADHRNIAISVSIAPTKVLAWDDVPEGDAYRHELEVDHTLGTPYREGDQGRVVLVGAVSDNGHITADALTYNGATMHLAADDTKGTFQTSIFYLWDTELPPDAGTYPVLFRANGIPAGSMAMNVLELLNVAQGSLVATGTSGDQGCVALSDRVVVPLPFSNLVGSLSYGLTEMRGATGIGINGPPGASEVWHSDNPNGATVSALTASAASSLQFDWVMESCDKANAAGVGVTFARIGLESVALP